MSYIIVEFVMSWPSLKGDVIIHYNSTEVYRNVMLDTFNECHGKMSEEVLETIIIQWS